VRHALQLAVLIALAGSAPTSAAQRPPTIQVVIDRAVFQPASVAAKVGDTVEWINRDFVDHTATTKKKAWDVAVPAGKTGRVVLKAAGTFDYYCRLHPNMTATVVVKKE
jgi:plastocyanin